MSEADDRVREHIERLHAKLQRRHQQRQQPRSSQMITLEEQLESKLSRLLRRPNPGTKEDLALLELAAEELCEEFRVSYFASGGRPVPAEVLDAIEAKLEQGRATSDIESAATSLQSAPVSKHKRINEELVDAIRAVLAEQGGHRRTAWPRFCDMVRKHAGRESGVYGWGDETIERYHRSKKNK